MALRAVDLNLVGLTTGAPAASLSTLPSLPFLSRVSGTRTSPAMITRLVVASVSQAIRTLAGSIPVFLASRKTRSTISSEIRSQTLSGWPSETDSEVKTKDDLTTQHPLGWLKTAQNEPF